MARKQAGKQKPTNKAFRKRFPPRDSAAVRALAANVRRLGKERDWSQDQLAAELEIEQNAVSLIENARSNPTILVVEEIARVFDIGLAELLEAPRGKNA
ncbi:transcriptional regulator [Bradyrhizobium ottawaense]|uniref:helix-turn-helix transcriptional regulator n=1 Tax=Bradyrhizobium ottawaense TaxID=931866 RepID=UPI000BE8D84B|nr:helix-turn-helix transcriptional regulator [Bradyrhizobium ottawaense]PDT64518.1 transcriptional regulator [Bradyrhizobium ottawaense]